MQVALKQLAMLNPVDATDRTDVWLTIPSGGSILLENVTWEGFETLLQTLGNHRSARLAYDNGRLEIMAPLPRHEYDKEAIAILIQDFAEQRDLNYEILGSTTWKRVDQLGGVEPDTCFYFQNEPAIRGKLDLDLSHDPPPDLALEIDITSKSLNRMPIYARLGVPEVWRYANGQLTIYSLQAGEYGVCDRSIALPEMPVAALVPFIDQHLTSGKKAMRRAFREWIRAMNLPA